MKNNPLYINDIAQGSSEWFTLRCGVPTASNFNMVITTKGEPSKQRQKFLYQLCGERLTGMIENGYQNEAMQRGIELEAEARAAYELMTDNTVQEAGFCFNDGCRLFGASADGYIHDKGVLEIKCPTLAVAVEYLDKGVLPTTYFQQVQGQLLVTGCEWCDFVSYFPSLPLLIVRVNRDEKFLAALEKELKVFCAELNELTERIGGKK